MIKNHKKYVKPKITEKSIKVNFFLSDPRFMDSFNSILIPPVFAQSGSCSDCVSCCSSGGCDEY